MTPDEFTSKWDVRLGWSFDWSKSEIETDLAAVVARARAEARKEALEEAERAVGWPGTVSAAETLVRLIPRWDGVAPLPEEEEKPCLECGTTTEDRSACPLCRKVYCRDCAEKPYAFCCDGVSPLPEEKP